MVTIYHKYTQETLDLDDRSPIPDDYTLVPPPVVQDGTPLAWINGAWGCAEPQLPPPMTEEQVAAILCRARQDAIARIDAHAESLCNQVITPGSAQMARYQRKESQARAWLAALEAGTLPADADVLAATYPAVIGEVGITAETAEGVARVIVAMADAWWAYGDAVEAARLAGKRAVEAAGTPEAVAAAEEAIVWPAAPQ